MKIFQQVCNGALSLEKEKEFLKDSVLDYAKMFVKNGNINELKSLYKLCDKHNIQIPQNNDTRFILLINLISNKLTMKIADASMNKIFDEFVIRIDSENAATKIREYINDIKPISNIEINQILTDGVNRYLFDAIVEDYVIKIYNKK